MPLEKKNVAFPFAQGMNEKPSERAQPAGEMRSAYNITITKTGEFNKRVGFNEEAFVEVGGASAPSQLYNCAAHENELIVFDGENAYSRYKSGGYKDRGTCVNAKLTQSSCNVDASSVDGAPAYCQAEGGDGELYEIFVWESRPMGIDDTRADRKNYPNDLDTVNYRNKQSRLLYSIRHRNSGSFIKDAVPLVINGKEYVDRDILLTKSGSNDNGFYVDSGEINVKGYGSTPTYTTREWENVASNGNRLIVEGESGTFYQLGRMDGAIVSSPQPNTVILADAADISNFSAGMIVTFSSSTDGTGSPVAVMIGAPYIDDDDSKAKFSVASSSGIAAADYIGVPVGASKFPLCFVEEVAAGASGTTEAVVDQLADSETFRNSSGDTTKSRVTSASSKMSGISTYLNVETGGNSPYFTTQPMLFSMEDGVVILTFSAQGEENLYIAPAASANTIGRWGIYQATFNLSASTPVFTPTTPSLATLTTSAKLDLDWKYPIWDADLCYTTAGGKHGILYLFNSNTGTVELEFWAYNSSSKIVQSAASGPVLKAGGSGNQVILKVPSSDIMNKERSFGSSDAAGWPAAVVPSRMVLKCVNDQSSGSQQNDSGNKIVFMLSSAEAADDDIYVYDTSLSLSGSYSWEAPNVKALLDTSEGSQTWTIPEDLLAIGTIEDTLTELAPFIYDGSAAAPSTTRFSAGTRTVLVNGAITNVKDVSTDKIYVFAEVAYKDARLGATIRDASTSGGLDETRYISSESRWIIRKNIANSSDTKVLGRNINILSDAFYMDEGSKAYFAGHSVHDGDPSTARTCLFNEDGEVVGVYASGQSALCHPYEIAQMSAAAPIGYTNTPMFALRSRLNSYKGESRRYAEDGSRVPPSSSFPMPQFGISVIENAERTYQYTTSFNPRVASIEFFPWRTFPSVQQAGTLFVGSGLLWAYNGSRFIENGFLQKPLVMKVTSQDSDFGNSTDENAGVIKGKYIIAAAYFYKDDNGVTHYSAMDYYGTGSNVERIAIDANAKKLNVRIAGTSITNKRMASSPVREDKTVIDMNSGNAGIAIFASADLEIPTGEDSELQQIPLILCTMQPMVKNARYHDISIDSPVQRIQFDQTSTFASPLLDNVPVQPSCPTDLTIHRNHLCVSTTDGYIYPSQSFSATLGSENSVMAPLFSAMHVISISEETNGTGASHLESNGQFLMAFNRNNVYAMGGNGPDSMNSGVAETFTAPEIIYLDQGIEVGAMCARIPEGILYQSMHGYYLLSGKGLSFLGAPVEDHTSQALGIQVVDETNEVIICTDRREPTGAGVGDGGPEFLVYNYEVNQWYTWRVSTSSGVRAKGICGFINSNGSRQLFFVTNDGKVWEQKNSKRYESGYSWSNQYSDYSLQGTNHYVIESGVKTGELQIPQFFSEFRLYRIAIPVEIHTMSDMTVRLYYNGEDAFDYAEETFTHRVSTSSDKDVSTEVVIKPKKQKCRSISVEILDKPVSASDGRGLVLNGLGLLVAARGMKTPYNTAITEVPEGS